MTLRAPARAPLAGWICFGAILLEMLKLHCLLKSGDLCHLIAALTCESALNISVRRYYAKCIKA